MQLARLDVAARFQFYPVCYRAARASTTLKRRYQDADASSDFPLQAYAQVLALLKPGVRSTWKKPEKLDACLDYGPPVSPDANSHTMLETLRSSEYRAFIDRACADLSRFKGAYHRRVDWSAGRLLLQGLLTDTPPKGLQRQYSLRCGNIHGDANSRNFLFGKNCSGAPCTLQVIDCGCHATKAPLLFDPAQLESDLKINLMATEAASGYQEIDPRQLPGWIAMERRSLDRPFDFRISTNLPESVKRAYNVVRSIRERVQELSAKGSDGQPDPRPYFYFLLYWTLRKVRHAAVPPTKRLFAMASVFLLLERLD